MTNNTPDPAPGFGVETATIEEFLRLIGEREDDEASLSEPRSSIRRAIFVARMLDQRGSRYEGFPLVTRYVIASFAHGSDLVSYRRATSSAVELMETARLTEERQQEAYEEIRAEIESGLEQLDLVQHVPVYEGILRHPADTGSEK